VEARNQADATIHGAEKQLKESGDKVSAGDKEAVESAVAALKAELNSENADTIKAKTDALVQALMKVGEAMYKAAAEQGAAQGGTGAGGPGDGAGGQGDAGGDSGGGAQAGNGEKVVDADFEEVDERKGKSA
jgi:molecular chaperone DnaK